MSNMAVPEVALRGARLSLLAGSELVHRVIEEARQGRSGYVCVTNVHQVTEAWRDEGFRRILDGARWVTTDSRVLELTLRALGVRYGSTVTYGVGILDDLCAAAAGSRVSVGLFGGSAAVVAELQRVLRTAHPTLDLRFAHAPDFGTAADLADDATIEMIERSGVELLLVGLGCPKQETWMHLASRRLDCMMIGVGAAFDFRAGQKRASPEWVRRAGVDWAWRLVSEPRRLWRRYLFGNTVFLVRVLPMVATRWIRPMRPAVSGMPRHPEAPTANGWSPRTDN